MNTQTEALRLAPFHLDDAALDWVYATRARLGLRQRLAQLFNVMLVPMDAAGLARLAGEQPGAVTQFMLGGAEAAMQRAHDLAASLEVPLLVSSDVEGGAIHPDAFTPMGNQLAMAAMNNPELYAQCVDVMAAEAAALGIHWSFTPVVDINAAFRSAIVATRSFGSSVDQVESLGRINVKGMQARGLASTAKHWPGEGFDARDQHLVTTLNPMSMGEWRACFGRIYRRLIDDGVMTIMSAHIALPDYARERGVDGLESYRPASVSQLLNVELLRRELGFNGLIVSDSTPMGGLTSWGSRSSVLPDVVENGCDMVLFTHDLSSDLDLLEEAVCAGRLSLTRVDESVARVLALKASLGLHLRALDERSPLWAQAASSVKTVGHRAVSDRAASASVTLVKDSGSVLPLTLERHRRIVVVTDPSRGGFGPIAMPKLVLPDLLRDRGFDVIPYEKENPPTAGSYDAMMFVLAQESMLTRSNIYLDWAGLLGQLDLAMARCWHEVPTLLVSFGHPYYLYDAPRMPCVINAYTAAEPQQRAVLSRLLGEEQFVGNSPVDAFCGLPDARF